MDYLELCKIKTELQTANVDPDQRSPLDLSYLQNSHIISSAVPKQSEPLPSAFLPKKIGYAISCKVFHQA